jgi:hypothetical protein
MLYIRVCRRILPGVGGAQWLNRLQNRDRRFMLSFTTVGVGLRKSAQPSVSVYSNLRNRHRKSAKTDGFLWISEVNRRYSVSVSAVKCWCRFRCRCQVSTVSLGSDRKPKIRSRFRLWTETGSATGRAGDGWVSETYMFWIRPETREGVDVNLLLAHTWLVQIKMLKRALHVKKQPARLFRYIFRTSLAGYVFTRGANVFKICTLPQTRV